ncbi:MAG: DEAD/DEAH box helicase family protein [Prevotella sp.]|nr:DEAD/DEAH box helicase family protein [Prevotella sp.]
MLKTIKYQERAVEELTEKVIKLLNNNEKRQKIVFEAPTGAGKTVMACEALARIADELQDRGDTLYQEVAFIWFAPRKLHLQSYASLKNAFDVTRRLSPVMFGDIDQSVGIQAGEILFVNWESVNKDNNVIVRENESFATLYEITRRTQEESGLPIVAIIDEEHTFWSKTADKSAAVLERINPAVELRISATPKTLQPDEKVTVYRKEVIEAEMIKKEVVLNPDIELDFREERTLNENLVRAAMAKRNQLAEMYKAMGIKINPLLLIQLPNDTNERMTAEDQEVSDLVKQYLKVMHDVRTENGLLAVWLANEKENLAGLEKPDNMTQVLLFKEAIALGWDCPRAAVLLIFRKLQSDQFTIQTVGRIMRMPEQRHYPKEELNIGYVYTDLAKDKIRIVTADSDYILKDTIVARRREHIHNVILPSYYSESPNIERNYLGPDFRKTLYDEAAKFWRLESGASFFKIGEMWGYYDDDEAGTLPDTDNEMINENRRRVANTIHLDVKTINVEIPQNVHFQNEEQILTVDKVRFARKVPEIDRVFTDYISGKGQKFERKGRTDKIGLYLLDMLADFFGVFDTDAKKVVLYHKNRKIFDRLLEIVLERYLEKRQKAKERSMIMRDFKRYDWEIPEERVYDSETNRIDIAKNHAMLPFVQLNEASKPEREFEAYLEENSEWIDWWYKNGDKGKQHFAITYGEGKAKSLFYVDFIIRMKNGHVYLFDTKSVGSDIHAPEKHNALLKYIKENSTDAQPLFGGIIIQQGSNWLYSKLPIENTTDTLNWDAFYPENEAPPQPSPLGRESGGRK